MTNPEFARNPLMNRRALLTYGLTFQPVDAILYLETVSKIVPYEIRETSGILTRGSCVYKIFMHFCELTESKNIV